MGLKSPQTTHHINLTEVRAHDRFRQCSLSQLPMFLYQKLQPGVSLQPGGVELCLLLDVSLLSLQQSDRVWSQQSHPHPTHCTVNFDPKIDKSSKSDPEQRQMILRSGHTQIKKYLKFQSSSCILSVSVEYPCLLGSSSCAQCSAATVQRADTETQS